MRTIADTITKEMTIDEIFSKHPSHAQKLAQVLTKAGLSCVGCSAATWETLEAGVMRHGYGEKELEEILDKLNTILLEETDASTISLTKCAAEKFRAIAESEGKPNTALRFDERPAGCSGFEYVLEFTDKTDSDDVVYNSHGINIYVKKSALGRLQGCEIDFVEGLQSGFKIVNPNVRASCGCGSSHGYDM